VRQRGLLSLRLVCRSVVFLALAAACSGCMVEEQRTKAEEADMATLPRDVREALERAPQAYAQPLNGAQWSKVHQLTGTDHALYQLQGTNGRGNKIEMEVTSAGRIIEVEEHGIPSDEVPGVVMEALNGKMPNFKPTRIEAIYQTGKAQPVCYGFERRDAAPKEIEVYISADGKTFLN